jgi:D-aminoacyl-tRNA deacylase
MRVILQRVLSASVAVNGKIISQIQKGYLLLVGVMKEDGPEDVEYLASKILNLKLFPKDGAEWKQGIQDLEGEILSVSQFTLFSKTSKGTKPDFHRAAGSSVSKPIYDSFLARLRSDYQAEKVSDGAFGEMMEVSLCNDGPVTIILDSKDKLL